MSTATTPALEVMPNWQHELSLISLMLLLFFALGLALKRSEAIQKHPARLAQFAALVLTWQALMAGLAVMGYFAVFSQAWRALPTVALTMVVTVYSATRPKTLTGLRGVDAWIWPALQSFRLPLELLLYSLFLQGVIGQQMTFSGYNFDILVGLSAPLMAWLLYVYPASRVTQRLSLLWNLAGLALLFNILIIAVLSVPFAFQVFTQEPANRMVAAFPFVWLPTFFIPLALFAHIVALRLAWRELHQNSYIQTQGASA